MVLHHENSRFYPGKVNGFGRCGICRSDLQTGKTVADITAFARMASVGHASLAGKWKSLSRVSFCKYQKPVRYLELENVGTRHHWERITPEQERQREEFSRQALSVHPAPRLPPSGELIVAGYVVTKHFSVFMDSIDGVGKVKYDLKAKKISFTEGSGEVIWK